MFELIKTFPYWLQILLVFIPILSLSIAAGAFIINVYQTVLTNKLTRAKIVTESFHSFLDDDMMHKAFYTIEYGVFKYNNDFHSSSQEREIDKLLRHFSNLAVMWENNLLDLSDIKPIQYFILRITNDKEITKYLKFVESWSSNENIGYHPYLSLILLSKKLNCEA